MEIDGALVIRCGEDTHVTVDGLKVENKGWVLEELNSSKDYEENVSIRGYTMDKQETAEYLLYEPGTYVIEADGVAKKV